MGLGLLLGVEPVGLVDHHQIPRLGGEEAGPPVVLLRLLPLLGGENAEGFQRGDDLVVRPEEVEPGGVQFGRVRGQADVEHGPHPVLPLLDQRRRAEDEQPADLPPRQERPEDQAGLDRLAQPHVVGHQPPRRPALEDPAADPELVREQLDP